MVHTRSPGGAAKQNARCKARRQRRAEHLLTLTYHSSQLALDIHERFVLVERGLRTRLDNALRVAEAQAEAASRRLAEHITALDARHAEVALLRASITGLEADVDRMEQEHRHANAQLSEIQQAHTALQTAHDDRALAHHHLREDHDGLRAELDHARAGRRRIEQQLTSAQAHARDLEQEHRHLHDEIRSLVEDNAVLRDVLAQAS